MKEFKAFDVKRVEKAFEWLQSEFADIEVIQSIDSLIQKSHMLNQTLSWSGEQMAISEYNMNLAKTQGYDEAIKLGVMLSPSLMKEYISTACAERTYEYSLTERLCRTIVHISNNLRTCISALKEQSKALPTN